MNKPSQRQIKKELAELRAFIDKDIDPVDTRVAYAIETAVRYVTEKTTWKKDVGYSLLKEARDTSHIIKKELGK